MRSPSNYREINLQQAGLRGLLRVIGAENPHLRVTQIDVDDDTDAEQVTQELLGGSNEDETAWRAGQWYAARLRPSPLRPDERHTTVVDHAQDGMRLRVRPPATWKPWSSSPSIGFHRGRDRSRSQSPRPASTSPTC